MHDSWKREFKGLRRSKIRSRKLFWLGEENDDSIYAESCYRKIKWRKEVSIVKDTVRVAGIQMKLVSESVKAREENLKRALKMMEEAASMGAEIICLPELFLGAATVEKEPSSTVQVMRDFAREHRSYVISNLYLFEQGEKYSVSHIIGPYGNIVGAYRKTHLFPWEHKFTKLKLGGDLPVFDTEHGKIGVLICQDAMVPEAPRVLTLKGAEVIFVQSRMPGAFLVPWRDTMRVRAVENQVFIVSVGGAGYHACGTLMVAPRLINDIIVEAGKDEQVVSATLNLEWLREMRQRKNQPLYFVRSVEDIRKGLEKVESYTFPLDRNPKLYHDLLKPHDPAEF